MKVLVFGSFNIDRVYSIPHLPERGETLYCDSFEVHVGGKGLNQALAFRNAGADTYAAGKIGPDGAFLKDYLKNGGVDVEDVDGSGAYSGHSVIEVAPDGQNQMVLFSGANRLIEPGFCDALLRKHADADLIVTQCETSCVGYVLEQAKKVGIQTVLNPSPLSEEVFTLPYEAVDCVILNEIEGERITGKKDPEQILKAVYGKNRGRVVLTLGAEGAAYYDGDRYARTDAFKVNAVDTTGAGDTFTGFCLYELFGGADPTDALRFGAAASALSVMKPGAAETIPKREDVVRFLKEHE